MGWQEVKQGGVKLDIDAVITWVDGNDPAHAEKRAKYNVGFHSASTASTRFASSGELRYAVLSIFRFCPFVRKVFIVTDNQNPAPIFDNDVLKHDELARIEVVNHTTLYAEHSDLLPVFSSRSIETMLHRLPNLSEHFVYFNDDMFIGSTLTESFFFSDGRPVLRGAFRPVHSLKDKIKKILRVKSARPSFKEAQKKASLLTGTTDRYFLAEHMPYPMRRSTLETYYADRTEQLRQHAGYRFRSEQQISPIGLTNHLELANGAPHAPALGYGYMKPPRTRRKWVKSLQTLEDLNFGKLVTLCIQSLDQFPENYRREVLHAFDRWYVQPEPHQPPSAPESNARPR